MRGGGLVSEFMWGIVDQLVLKLAHQEKNLLRQCVFQAIIAWVYHESSSKSRVERNSKDTDKLNTFSKKYNPFSNQKNLKNILTEVVAADKVNIDQAGDMEKAW